MQFDRHTLVLLVRPPDAPELTDEEADALQDEHLAFRADLRDQGYLIGGGPVVDQDDERVRGVSIMYGFHAATQLRVTPRASSLGGPSGEASIDNEEARPTVCGAGAIVKRLASDSTHTARVNPSAPCRSSRRDDRADAARCHGRMRVERAVVVLNDMQRTATYEAIDRDAARLLPPSRVGAAVQPGEERAC